DGRERPRFGSVKRVIAIATVHQLAVVAMRQVEIANEHVSGIEAAIIVRVARAAATLAELGVATADLLVRVLREPAPATSEREELIFAMANAVVSLACINIAQIEIARHQPPPDVFANH